MRHCRNTLILLAFSMWLTAYMHTSVVFAAGVANRRIIDIELLSYSDSYRIKIHLSALPAYEITRPRPGQPLRIQLNQTEADASMVARPASNNLIQHVWIVPGDSGLTMLEFPLSSSQVEVSDWTVLSPEPMIVVNLKPRPGVLLPGTIGRAGAIPRPVTTVRSETASAAFTPALTPRKEVVATSTTSASTPQTAHATPLSPGSLAKLALPQATSDPAAVKPSVQVKIPPALPPAEGAVAKEEPPKPAHAKAPSDEKEPKAHSGADALEDDEETSPFERVDMGFPHAEEMLKAYKEGRFADAVEIGIGALTDRRFVGSVDTLLYFLAECRYQFEADPSRMSQGQAPDWLAALNYCQQAKRNAPNSPLHLLVDYRLSQIYDRLGRHEEQKAVLADLLKEKGLLDPARVLLERAKAALTLFSGPGAGDRGKDDGLLTEAREALNSFIQKYPGNKGYGDALFLLGDVYYLEEDYAKAYDTILKATQEAKRTSIGGGFSISPEIFAHFALAAHRSGKIDLAHPNDDQNTQELIRVLNISRDPRTRLEYARILDASGSRDEAMAQYDDLVQDLAAAPSSPVRKEARLALTRYALSDTIAGGTNRRVHYLDYQDAVKALTEMYEQSYSLSERANLMAERSRHLAAQGHPAEALRLVLPYMKKGFFDDKTEAELRRGVWTSLPDAMRHYQREGQYLLALQIYDVFREYLSEHPQRSDIDLTCASMFLEAGLTREAGEALDDMPTDDLTAEERNRAQALRAEAALDRSSANFRQEAQDLLSPENDEFMRARVLRMLGRSYADEGKHSYAAQTYLQGTALKEELPWQERLAFFTLAAEEYEQANYRPKAIETYWKGIREFEGLGVPVVQAEKQVGAFLFSMGENYRFLGDDLKAAKAFEQYLHHYPKGVDAPAATYFLAHAYEKTNRSKEAIEQYGKLAGQAKETPFWAKVAEGAASQLQWDEAHPYLSKGATP